jgi:hypothetical protein
MSNLRLGEQVAPIRRGEDPLAQPFEPLQVVDRLDSGPGRFVEAAETNAA